MMEQLGDGNAQQTIHFRKLLSLTGFVQLIWRPRNSRARKRARSMKRRQVIEGMGAASLVLPLGGCDFGPSYRYRYRLALEVEVDGKALHGFNVVEDWARTRSFPEKGIVDGQNGESIVMELRPGKVLVTLLSVITRIPDAKRGGNWTKQRGYWRNFHIHYGLKDDRGEDHFTFMKRWLVARGDRDLPLDDLPDLVTFDDVNDPRTVKLVDPRNLEASFGPGVVLKRATIAIVDNNTPLTRGIEKKLPWIVGLKGNYLFNFGTDKTSSRGNSLSETLHGGYFATGIY